MKRNRDRRYAVFMIYRVLPAFAALFLLAAPAIAQDAETPYWATIRADTSEVNMRVGPGEDYRILWVFHRPHLPLKVLRLKEGWRFVEDPSGARGWMLARFLSRNRGAIVTGAEPADMRAKADAGSALRWRLQPGVTAKLGDCSGRWCQREIAGRTGFVAQDHLWGAGEP